MKRLIYILPILMLAAASCSDIKSKNITGDLPTLILPNAHDTIRTNPANFKWEEIKGATKYQLQIAKPSFSHMSQYVLDSIMPSTNFSIKLDSGKYELKLTALNSGYTSRTLGPIAFSVKLGAGANTPSGSGVLTLTYPKENEFYNNQFDGKFKWNALTGATNFEFELRKSAPFNSGTSVYTMTPGNTLEATLPEAKKPLAPGKYGWRVMANNEAGNLMAQKIWYFIIDTLKPPTPTLAEPANNAMVSITTNTVFSWNYAPENDPNQSPITSIFEISATESFSDLLESKELTANTYTVKLSSLTAGTNYFWRVRNKDKAGNIGANPTANKFTTN